ncbi:MAG: type I-D CRISPR-associated endonuclease Cas1d [Chloroflexota bacterium]|nr:type I-D CRISPR-associated endonuclease Cas1d [Chloroflexota bacterium]
MATLHVTEPYTLIKKDGDTLLVHIPANEELERESSKVRVPLIKVDEVVILGDSTVTSPALGAMLDQRIAITFLTRYGTFRGRLVPSFSRNSLLRLAQFRAHENPKQSLKFAKQFVIGKLSNLRTILLRSNRKMDDSEVTRSANSLDGVIQQVKKLESDGSPPPDPGKPQSGTAWGSLQGLEGAGTGRYFAVFDRLLRGDPKMRFNGRNRRPPRDPVNALLSYGYTLLMHQCAAALQLVGFDPYIGYLHSSQYSKPSLALDLMEEFRGPVIDSVVLTVVNNKIITSADFQTEMGSCRIEDDPRRTYLRKYEARLNTEIKHPIFGYKATYRRCIELQARLLAKTINGEIDAYPPFKIR